MGSTGPASPLEPPELPVELLAPPPEDDPPEPELWLLPLLPPLADPADPPPDVLPAPLEAPLLEPPPEPLLLPPELWPKDPEVDGFALQAAIETAASKAASFVERSVFIVCLS